MSTLKRIYLALIAIGNSLQSPFLLAIRLLWGGFFFHTGFGKLSNIDAIIAYFHTLGVPMPAFSAYSAAMIECFGGAFLFLRIGLQASGNPLDVHHGRRFLHSLSRCGPHDLQRSARSACERSIQFLFRCTDHFHFRSRLAFIGQLARKILFQATHLIIFY